MFHAHSEVCNKRLVLVWNHKVETLQMLNQELCQFNQRRLIKLSQPVRAQDETRIEYVIHFINSVFIPPVFCPNHLSSDTDSLQVFYPSLHYTSLQPAPSWAPPGLEKLLPQWTGKK